MPWVCEANCSSQMKNFHHLSPLTCITFHGNFSSEFGEWCLLKYACTNCLQLVALGCQNNLQHIWHLCSLFYWKFLIIYLSVIPKTCVASKEKSKKGTNVSFIWGLDDQLDLEQKGLSKSTLSHREYKLRDKIKVNFEMISCINSYYVMMGKHLSLGVLCINSCLSSATIHI